MGGAASSPTILLSTMFAGSVTRWRHTSTKAGTPAIMKSIEGELDSPRLERSGGSVTLADFKAPYISAIKNFVDLKLIQKAGFKFAIDVMYGAGRGVLKGVLPRA